MVWTGVVAEDLVRSGLIPDVFSTIGGYSRDRRSKRTAMEGRRVKV